MTDIKHILCPVDFSDYSSHSLAHAAALARWYGASLTVLHVWPLTPPPPPYDELASATLLMLPEQREASLTRVRALVDTLGEPHVKAEARLEEGSPAQVIVDVARRTHAGLLVLGTHGRSGFDRLVLGSVTEKILHRSPCPVLTVPRTVDGPALQRVTYARIVCALDEARADNAAFTFAQSLARESKAELVLLHVVEPFPEPTLAEVGYFEAAQEAEMLVQQWTSALDALAAPALAAGSRRRTRVVSGKPGAEILRVAADEHADLIVLGVRGRGAVDLWVFGSTASRVVRHASCPVLTVGVRPEAKA
jgi:nucleotide-binding universal stress UspA family protein